MRRRARRGRGETAHRRERETAFQQSGNGAWDVATDDETLAHADRVAANDDGIADCEIDKLAVCVTEDECDALNDTLNDAVEHNVAVEAGDIGSGVAELENVPLPHADRVAAYDEGTTDKDKVRL